ncbi:MAG: glucose 1-dehydrogenase [bacterium]|nr:glucose 1-dehydrogenase [bacterium]
MKDLKNKVAVITGGGAGIGKAISLAFAAAGASIAVADIDARSAEETARQVQNLGREALAITADVSKEQDVDLIFDKSLEKFAKTDILVNNAGISHPTESILDLDPAFIDKVFSIDYKGVYLCSRRAGREMLHQKSGCILNISSIAGIAPLPLAMYGPMKSAVNMLTRILAREWASDNIRVNAIAPGYVLTPLIKDMIESGLRNPDLIINRTPMGKMLDPDDVAEAALYLASDSARHITGIILPVDGGWLSDGGWSAYNR